MDNRVIHECSPTNRTRLFKLKSAKVIGLIQVKGGAGRSTTATTIAGELARTSRVTLIDCDMPQGTSASWVALRQSQAPSGANLSGDTARDPKELLAKVEKARSQADYIVLDGPPRIAELARAILVLSDLALIPISASAAEVWATSDMLPLIEEAKSVRPVDARLLWTRFRPHTRLAQALSTEGVTELGLPVMKARIGYRVAYSEALGSGQTAAETGDPMARDEVVSLVVEIQRILK